MANEEALTLDSLALNDGTVFGMVNLSMPPPRQRQDWIGAADSESQLLFRNPLHENRKVTARIAVITQSTMDIAHDKILLVLDKLQKASKYIDGIALTWTPATGTRTVTFDVLSGEIADLPIDWESGWLAKSPEFTVELTCKPYWRGTETLTSTASSSTPFVTLEVPSVTGDVPALGRLIITDTATQSRRHVEWGLEGPLTYNNATSLLIDSDDMVTSGFGGVQATQAGMYDPNATGNNCVSATLYAAAVAIAGTGNLSHVGTFRVKARALPPGIGSYVRLSWQAGDGPVTSNPWATHVLGGQFVELDLGLITIPPVVVGTQRWTGRIDGYTTVEGSVMKIDYLELVPVSDGYGKARAAYSYAPGVIVGNDQFTGTTASAVLNARAAPIGGTWATSGDATDIIFADNFNIGVLDAIESITRSTSVSETTGRFGILGSTNYTDVQVDVRSHVVKGFPKSYEQAVVARWTDASNHLRLTVVSAGGVKIEQVVAGVVTTLALSTWIRQEKTTYRYRLIAFATGRVIGQVFSDTGGLLVSLEALSSVLATAGTLATGKPGLRDRSTGTTSAARYFTEFSVSTPNPEPIALYSGRNLQVRYDDTIRQDSTGTYTGRPQSYRGGRLVVPVGTSRVLVKARRNDIDVAADDQVTDATQVQVGWTPRGLAVPR